MYAVEAIYFDPNNTSLPWYSGKTSWVVAKRIESWGSAVTSPEVLNAVIDGWVDEAGEPHGFPFDLAVGDVVGVLPSVKFGVAVLGMTNTFRKTKKGIDALTDLGGFYGDLGVQTWEEFGALVGPMLDAIWPAVAEWSAEVEAIGFGNGPYPPFPDVECPYDFPVPEVSTPSPDVTDPPPKLVIAGQDASP